MRKHAEVCSEDELINQISDITSRVDDLLTYTQPPLNSTSALRVISATATAGQLIIIINNYASYLFSKLVTKLNTDSGLYSMLFGESHT